MWGYVGRIGARIRAPSQRSGQNVSHKVRAAVSYEEMRRDCPTKMPSSFNFAEDVLERYASNPAFQKNLALQHVDSSGETRVNWSYADLNLETKRCASALRTLGRIRKMVVMMGNVPEWWLIMLSALRNDTVTIPTTRLLDEAAVKRRILRYNLSF